MERIVGRTVGLLPAEIGILYARWRYGVDLGRANPVDAVKFSAVPVLLIHGEEDINILPQHSRLLAQADPVYAELWLVPGAGHCGAVGAAPNEFWNRVLKFFAQHNGSRAASTYKHRDKTKAPGQNKSPGGSGAHHHTCWGHLRR